MPEESQPDACERCQMFLTDLQALCVKHRVLFHVDNDVYELGAVIVDEHFRDPNGVEFVLDITDIEDAVRNAVWPVLHPPKKEQ